MKLPEIMPKMILPIIRTVLSKSCHVPVEQSITLVLIRVDVHCSWLCQVFSVETNYCA